MQGDKKIILADLGILFIALAWGLNFSMITWVLEYITPMYYLSLRFLLAAIVMIAIFCKSIRNISNADIKCGILAGTFLALSFAAQSIGLQYTTPGKAGFLASSCVVIVPILMWFIYKEKPKSNVIIGAIIAFIGLAVMSLTESFTLQIGDVLEIMCAFFFAVQTIIVFHYAKEIQPIRMAVVQIGTAGLICLAVAGIWEPMPQMQTINMPVIIVISYGVLFCTILSFIIQGYAQRITPPSHVAITLCFEAVFAMIFALIAGYEETTIRGLAGSGIVLVGFVITEMKFAKNETNRN